jgi:hypothetical protein
MLIQNCRTKELNLSSNYLKEFSEFASVGLLKCHGPLNNLSTIGACTIKFYTVVIDAKELVPFHSAKKVLKLFIP